jgi:thymidine phosphorylase
VDPGVGIHLAAKTGAEVAAGDALARLRVRKESDADVARVRAAFSLEDAPPAPSELVLERIAP